VRVLVQAFEFLFVHVGVCVGLAVVAVLVLVLVLEVLVVVLDVRVFVGHVSVLVLVGVWRLGHRARSILSAQDKSSRITRMYARPPMSRLLHTYGIGPRPQLTTVRYCLGLAKYPFTDRGRGMTRTNSALLATAEG